MWDFKMVCYIKPEHSTHHYTNDIALITEELFGKKWNNHSSQKFCIIINLAIILPLKGSHQHC